VSKNGLQFQIQKKKIKVEFVFRFILFESYRNKIGSNGPSFKCLQDFFQIFCQLSFFLTFLANYYPIEKRVGITVGDGF
jgi:hypothetical protein